jgi:hypothetical protein
VTELSVLEFEEIVLELDKNSASMFELLFGDEYMDLVLVISSGLTGSLRFTDRGSGDYPCY